MEYRKGRNRELQGFQLSGEGTAETLIGLMPQRNVFSWTVMIVASNEHGYYRDGVERFCMMMDQGVLPDGFAFSAVLQSCVGYDSVELGEMVHAIF